MAQQVAGKNTNATERLYEVLLKMSKYHTSRNVAQVVQDSLGVKAEDDNRAALDAFSLLTKLINSAEKEAKTIYPEEWDTVGPTLRWSTSLFCAH